MTFWVVLVIGAAALLMLGVNWLLARVNVHPVHPEETRTGVIQIAERVERWADGRLNRVRAGEGSDRADDTRPR